MYEEMKERLKRLKDALSLEWGELAAKLDISRSMLDHVRNGLRTFGPKTVRRLELAEREAGIQPEGAGRLRLPLVLKEEPGEHVAKNVAAEMRLDLRDMKRDLAAMDKRVDEMMKRLEGS